MKNILKLLSFAFLFTFSTKAYSQLDTLNYVKQFEINKANYIGQPLSVLLNDMTQIQPKTVHSLTRIYQKNLSAFSVFHFIPLEKQYGKNNITMIIYWQNPIVHSQAFLLSQQNGFNFTLAERNFYGDKIIENVKVFIP